MEGRVAFLVCCVDIARVGLEDQCLGALKNRRENDEHADKREGERHMAGVC